MRHRRLVIVLSVAAAVLALVSAFPAVSARIVAGRLRTALGTRVHVGWLTWNPMRGRWTLANVRIAADRGAPALAARRVAIEAHLWDLVRGRYRVRTATLSGSRFRLRATPAGWELPLPASETASPQDVALPTLTVDWASAPRAVVSLEPAKDVRSVLRARQLEAMIALDPEHVHAMLWTRGRLDRGSIALVGRVRSLSDARRLRLRIMAEDLDVARVLRLASGAAVRDLRGRLTLHAKYDEHAAGGHATRTATGSLSGEDLALGTRGVDAIWARSLALSRFDVDLDKRLVALGVVRLEGPETWVRRTESGFALPGTGSGADATDERWTVTAKGVGVSGGALHIADVERKQQIDVGIVTAELGGIGRARDAIPVALEATLGSGGRGSFKGEVVREPFHGRGHVDLAAVELPALVRFARTSPALDSGRVSTSLDVEFGSGKADVTGTLHAQDLKTVSPDLARPEDVMAFKDLRVAIRRTRWESRSVDLDSVELEWPYVLIDRSTAGIFPLTLFERPESAGANAAPPPRVRVKRFDVMGGRIDFRDATLEPPYWRALAGFKSTTESIEAAPLRVASLQATALVDELSPLRVEGTIGDRTRFVADVEKLSLPPFNPYLEGTAPYTLSSGTVSAHSEIVFERSQLEVQNRVVLSRLGLSGTTGQDFVQREVGIPLTLALALMKDYRGNIELGLPFGGDVKDPTFSMRSVVMQAIVRTIRGAILSPLNALGRVFLRGGRVEQFTLDPIPFPPGSRALDEPGRARIQQIVRVIEGRPDLIVRVRGEVAQADLDRLRDEAAVAALDDGSSASEELRQFLKARIAGASPPPLEPEDRMRLERLQASGPWPTDAVRALAIDRGAAAAATFIVDFKIAPARVAAEPPADLRQDALAPAPGATVELRER